MRSLLHLFKQSRNGLVVGASATYGLNQVSSTDTKKAQHREQPRKQQLHQQDKGHLLLQSTFKNYATFNQDPISPPRTLATSHGNATFNQDPISPPRMLAISHGHRTTTRIENLDKGRPPMMMAELRPLATSKDYDDATDFEVAKVCLLIVAISSYKIFETVWWYYDYESWYYMNHEPEDYCLETLERIEADKAAYTAQATEQRKRATQHGNMPAKSTTIIKFPTKNMNFWINVLNEPAKLKDVEQKILYRHHYLDHGFFASSFVQYSCQVQITDVKVSSSNEVNVTYDATYKVTDDEQTEAIAAHNSETKSATTLYRGSSYPRDAWGRRIFTEKEKQGEEYKVGGGGGDLSCLWFIDGLLLSLLSLMDFCCRCCR